MSLLEKIIQDIDKFQKANGVRPDRIVLWEKLLTDACRELATKRAIFGPQTTTTTTDFEHDPPQTTVKTILTDEDLERFPITIEDFALYVYRECGCEILLQRQRGMPPTNIIDAIVRAKRLRIHRDGNSSQ